MHSCSCLCDIFNCIFEQEQPLASLLLLALADAIPYDKPYSITHHNSCSTFIRYPASSSISIRGISLLPRLIHQFTRDVASCLHELLSFKECCSLDTCGCGFEQISCGATTCLQAALSAGRGL